MNLATAFGATARKYGQKTALFWGDEEISYNSILRETETLGDLLKTRFAVKPGDRVALLLKNCPEFVPALFGVLQADAVVVPINNFLKPDEISFILADAGIDVLITDSSSRETVEKLTNARPQLKTWLVEDFKTSVNPQAAIRNPQSTESDLAVLIYTSGTTGHPKGAMLTHGNLLHNVDSSRQVLESIDADRFALLLPMFHSFMLTVCILLPLLTGGSVVLVKSLHPIKNLIEEIVRRQANILPAVPQIFRTMAHGSVPVDLPLRICISGGAALPGEILREFNAKFPFPLLEGYGLSEASPVCSFNPLKGPWKAGSIGVPIPNVEMSVQDDAGQMLEPGETGEVCIRGGNVMPGYWNQPEQTAESLRKGWLLTGDVGHRDADGYYFITDRKKDMLIVNGINVYPRQIEEVIYQYPGIKEVAVIGRPDSRKGESPEAYLSLNEGAQVDEKNLLQFVRERLADYKVPRRVVFMTALPRNATGKILKTALRNTPVNI